MRPLQDIQLVTLPEPHVSALWSDHSQSQSPMPIISDVTSITPSPSVLPPHPFENKYHFLPGTERLVGHPDWASAPGYGEHSLWYFFGFEPDHTGRPLDRSRAICKLCGDTVSCCGAGTVEIRNHLSNRHHIKPREQPNACGARLASGTAPSTVVERF